MTAVCAVLVAACVTLVDVPMGDVEVVTKQGKTYTGKVLGKTGSTVLIQTATGERVRLNFDDIASAKSVAAAPPPVTPTTTSAPAAVEPEAYRRKLAELKPSNADGWRQLGQWCFEQNYPIQGRAAFEKAVSLDATKSREIRLQLGLLLLKANRGDEAIEVCEALARDFPRDPEVLEFREKALAGIGDKVDNMARLAKGSWDDKDYAGVLKTLDAYAKGAPKTDLDMLSRRLQGTINMTLDQLLVECRLKVPCPACRGMSGICEKCQATNISLTWWSEYEATTLIEVLGQRARQAYGLMPEPTRKVLLDPASVTPEDSQRLLTQIRNRKAFFLTGLKRAKYLYEIVFRVQAKDLEAQNATKARITEIERLIGKMEKA